MRLTAHFDLSEFACKDGTPVPADLHGNVQALAKQLEVIREVCGSPLVVLSGYRTPSHNRKTGGVKNSQHLKAKAADLSPQTVSVSRLHDIILDLIEAKKIHDGGVGLYNSFVHYDIGPSRRWRG